MNQSLRAKAFTNKGDIYFNQGKYDPASKDGKFLLAHELTHTIQQGAAAPKTDVPTPEKQANTENTTPDKKEAKAISETEAPALKVAAPEQAGGAVPAAAKDAKVEIPKAGKKDENGKETTEEAPKEEAAPEKKKPDPKADPNFMEVTKNIAVTADQQAEHQPAGVLSEDSQEAAESPGNERESIAQAEQVEEMKEAEPKPFNAASFKAKLMARIDSMQLPENQDEADNFDENNNIDEVNKEAVGDVNAEKDASVGPVAETSQAAPQTGKVPKRKTVPLKPLQKGKKPGSVGASKAVPSKRGDEEISQPLKEQTAEVDNKMAENNVTDEQLEKSQEPKFTQALDSKKEAKTKAEEAPKNFRKKEEETLQGTAAKSDAASQEQLAGMHAMRGGAFQKVMGNQKGTGKKDTSERERIAGEINTIYEDTKKDVEGILDTLEDRVSSMFEITAEKAKKTFEDYVEGCMAWYKIERYSGPLGLIKWTKDLFVGLPDEVNKFFVKGKEKFTEVMEQGINVIAKHVAGQLNMAQTRIKRGQKDVEKYVEGLPKNLRHLGKEAASEIQDKFSALQDDVNSREEALIDTLAQEYVAAMEEVDERIEEMKAENRGLIDSVMGFINGVIDTINKLVEMITNLFAAIKSVIGVIIQDPIGFMGNLFDGIGKGIDAFKANIQTHLLSGLLEWLTGSLGPMGIVMPKDIFSLSGVFNLVFQVLGLGWDYIRLKAVKMMGEPVVKALEGGYDMFKTFATKGIDGIWEFLKDKFSDLKEIVIDAIKDMLITQVIQAGIKWLLSLLIPGAGFIKAIMAIKDLIVFFVESAMMLIPAITEAILALAAGSVAGVAKAIEFGLAKLIGLVINLFAKLIGLGGLSKKVQAIFKKIRKRVDKAVSKLLKKARKAGRKLMRKLGIGKKSEQKGKEERSKQEMEADLKMGIKEGTTYVKSTEGKDKKEIDKRLKQIGNKYDLKILNLVVDKNNPDGMDKVHVHGEVNPVNNSEIIEVNLVNGSVSRPPVGRAYLVKQQFNYGPHYVAYLHTGELFDLGFNPKNKNSHGDPIIEIDRKKMNSIKAVGAVSVSASDIDSSVLNKKLRTKVNAKIAQYEGQGYKITVNDCLVFSLDILNSIFNSGIPNPPKDDGQYETWFNGLTKKEK